MKGEGDKGGTGWCPADGKRENPSPRKKKKTEKKSRNLHCPSGGSLRRKSVYRTTQYPGEKRKELTTRKLVSGF